MRLPGAVAAALALAGCATSGSVSEPALAPHQAAARGPVSDDARKPVGDAPRIGIATAFAPELAALLPSLADREVTQINGRPYYTGTISGKPVVLFETGVSIVNAAMNTQVLLDHFDIEAIIVSGIAGGVDPELSIGDVTVPERWGQYNEMIYMREIQPGVFAAYEGYTQDYAPFQFMRPNGVRVVSQASPQPARRFWFEADPALLSVARAAAPDVALTQCASADHCLAEKPELVIGGSGVTGSVYLDNSAFREYLFETFAADVVEMETAAIAMVAHANSVPYVAFRSLSDLAGGGDAQENEMDTFMDIAAINAAAVVLAFLERYPVTARD